METWFEKLVRKLTNLTPAQEMLVEIIVSVITAVITVLWLKGR